jgi:hypothetical protein
MCELAHTPLGIGNLYAVLLPAYARLAGGNQMVPVRMEFDTEYGRVEGYLAELGRPGASTSTSRIEGARTRD